MSHYDAIVLGAGSPGEHCVAALAAGGLKTAVVERELVGGECSYYACIPSKTLLRAGEAAHDAREAGAPGAQVDVRWALDWRDFMVSKYDDTNAAQWLTDNGIDVLRGTGRLAGPGAIEVDGVRYTADHIVLANGADAFIPPVPGLRELDGIWTNREVTGMKAIPRRLLILGGGAVGVEMAQAVKRLGAEEVTVVEGGPHLMARDPAPVGEALAEILERDGVTVLTETHAAAARREGEDYVLVLDDGRELRGDKLLVCTGRRPRVAELGLDTIGVEANPKGVPVDDHLRVADGIWAIGDIVGIAPTTHMGKYQGDVVADNILGHPRPANYDAIPSVVYTDPQGASVGATDAPYRGTAQLSSLAKTETYTRQYADSNGYLTLLSDGERLVGAHAVGPEAGEWLQQATLAIRARIPVAVLRDVIQPFPTFSEIYVAAFSELWTALNSGASVEPASAIASKS